MRAPVGFVICAHSRISIHSKRAKLAPSHSYQPVIKWVIILMDYMYSHRCYRHRCLIHLCRNRCHRTCQCQSKCIRCLMRPITTAIILLIITITICLTFTISHRQCRRNSIQRRRHRHPWPPIHNPCIPNSDAKFHESICVIEANLLC